VLVGFPAYLRNLALVARDELGIDPRELGIKSLIAHLGLEDRTALEELWGAPAYDTYGANEFGSIAADCEHKSGMHVFEDAFVAEIVESGSGRAVPEGERGVVYLTTLFKHVAPMIRFNTNDISAWVEGPPCACGSTHRRISKIFGRADNMVKLRGTNIFPEAVGAVVAAHALANGEYVCIVERDTEGREDMAVQFEFLAAVDAAQKARTEAELATRLKEALGVKLRLQGVPAGELDALTGLSSTSKIRRLIDRR
jgi:phenylacetate-CoA ligase